MTVRLPEIKNKPTPTRERLLNQPATSTKLPVLMCPSATQLQPAGGGAPNSATVPGRFAKGNYAGNFGGGFANQNDNPTGWGNPALRGVFSFRPNWSARMSDLQDGSSNTVMVAEILGVDSNGDCRGCWGHISGPIFSGHSMGIVNNQVDPNYVLTPNANFNANANFADCPVWCANNLQPIVCFSDCTSDGNRGGVGPRSQHVGGVQVLLGDGSARFVSDNIDKRVWQGVLTIAGKETLGEW